MSPSERPGHEHLRLVDLRRLLYEEAPAEEAAAMQSSLQGCADCRARYDRLAEAQAGFLDSVRPELESAAILARLEAPAAAPPSKLAARWYERLGGGLVPALMAAVLLLAVAPVALDLGAPEPPTTRQKGGGVGLVMFVKDGAGIHRGADGERLRQGDQVQFRYSAGGHRHLFVLSVDARGVLSPLYPEDPTESISVEAEGTHVLEGSVILDDAVGPERIFAIFSDGPVTFGELDRAARDGLARAGGVTGLSALPLERDDVEQATVLIVKE